MITAKDVFLSSPKKRKEMILGEVTGFNNLDSEIDKTREIARVINTFLEDYFILKIQQDEDLYNGSVLLNENLSSAFDLEINRFKPIAINELKGTVPTKDAILLSSKNVYEMAGATKLAFANKVTRTLSTTMGLLWERLASISPYAINPESEFNLKIQGIDLICMNHTTGVIEYQQLKTQHNTLTGSQKPRSVEELLIHDNPIFCACFANNSSWTFNHPDIPRVSGGDFWSRIGIPYELFLSKARSLVLELENEYVKLL